MHQRDPQETRPHIGSDPVTPTRLTCGGKKRVLERADRGYERKVARGHRTPNILAGFTETLPNVMRGLATGSGRPLPSQGGGGGNADNNRGGTRTGHEGS